MYILRCFLGSGLLLTGVLDAALEGLPIKLLFISNLEKPYDYLIWLNFFFLLAAAAMDNFLGLSVSSDLFIAEWTARSF